MCARAIDMRGEGKRRGPSAELHRYRLDGRSSMGPCRRRWRKRVQEYVVRVVGMALVAVVLYYSRVVLPPLTACSPRSPC